MLPSSFQTIDSWPEGSTATITQDDLSYDAKSQRSNNNYSDRKNARINEFSPSNKQRNNLFEQKILEEDEFDDELNWLNNLSLINASAWFDLLSANEQLLNCNLNWAIQNSIKQKVKDKGSPLSQYRLDS